ncbi:hypothetical protein Tsp_12839 [Trichinella spiralis]|uniref:hypothetical protein n=1 Tax=Trichinella spiralis TaxID=6334 RepID=UPI0001EFD237|nr:hypothetical protein Tsp_12839 [Trichinella spiralis]
MNAVKICLQSCSGRANSSSDDAGYLTMDFVTSHLLNQAVTTVPARAINICIICMYLNRWPFLFTMRMRFSSGLFTTLSWPISCLFDVKHPLGWPKVLIGKSQVLRIDHHVGFIVYNWLVGWLCELSDKARTLKIRFGYLFQRARVHVCMSSTAIDCQMNK